MLDHIPQGRLLGTFPFDPIVHAYAWVGCLQRPEVAAKVWCNKRGEIEGALIDCEWSSYHLVATTREAVHSLLDRLPAQSPLGWRLLFPEWATRDVMERYPAAQVSYEILHLCRHEDYHPPLLPSVELARLTPQLVERYVFDLELVKALSGISWRQSLHPIYGAIVDDQVVSIADGTAMTGHAAIVQQVYTIPAYRRRGLARAAVARLTEEVFALGRVSLYASDYTNNPSLSLCRSLGYRPIAVFGRAEHES